MDRRTFLRHGESVTIGLLGCWAAGCTRIYFAPYREEGGRLVVEKTAFEAQTPFVLLEHARLPNPIYLRRLGDRSYVALLLRCTHRGCQPDPAGDRLACPCHGSQYTVTGDVIQGPAALPLRRFPTTSDERYVYIILPDTL